MLPSRYDMLLEAYIGVIQKSYDACMTGYNGAMLESCTTFPENMQSWLKGINWRLFSICLPLGCHYPIRQKARRPERLVHELKQVPLP
jgi:hypothetical protein